MKKQGSLRIICSTIILSFVLAGCQAPQPQPTMTPTIEIPTSTPLPPTITPVPPTATATLTPTPAIIFASESPIKVGNYVITITNARITDIGWNPFGLPSNNGLTFDVKEESGKENELTQLGIWFTDDQGVKFEKYAPESMTNLSGVTSLDWNVWFIDLPVGILMYFPSGEIIDLTPLIKQ